LIYTKIVVILMYFGNASSRSVDRSIGRSITFWRFKGLNPFRKSGRFCLNMPTVLSTVVVVNAGENATRRPKPGAWNLDRQNF
jgi:hypothetical protein